MSPAPKIRNVSPEIMGVARPRSAFFIPSPGFTLVELLVVIAIVGLVAGLAIVATGKARAAALAAKDLSNLRQTASLVLTAAADFGKIPGASLEDAANNWVKVVRDYLPGSYPPDGEYPPVKLLDPNHPYLCPSLIALRPDKPRIEIPHQWAMNWSVNMAYLPAIPRPSRTVMLTTGCFAREYGWTLQFFPSQRRNPDFPYPARRLSLTDGTGVGPPDRATLMAFVDGHVERVSFRDPNYFPVNTNKPAWTP